MKDEGWLRHGLRFGRWRSRLHPVECAVCLWERTDEVRAGARANRSTRDACCCAAPRGVCETHGDANVREVVTDLSSRRPRAGAKRRLTQCCCCSFRQEQKRIDRAWARTQASFKGGARLKRGAPSVPPVQLQPQPQHPQLSSVRETALRASGCFCPHHPPPTPSSFGRDGRASSQV